MCLIPHPKHLAGNTFALGPKILNPSSGSLISFWIIRRKSELAEIIEKITFHFHFDFVHDNLKCLQFHVHSAELCLGGSYIKFKVEYFIELVAFGHVFDFLFGGFFEHFEFVDFGVDFVEEVVVFVDAFVEGLSEAGDGFVELLATDKMVLALDH
jgi:hypothetical protein